MPIRNSEELEDRKERTNSRNPGDLQEKVQTESPAELTEVTLIVKLGFFALNTE